MDVTAYLPHAWEQFALANAGAAAALAGLVFVGISINLSEITQSVRLTGRALEAFALLVGILVESVLVLVPGITPTGLGIALLVVGGTIWMVVTTHQAKAVKERRSQGSQGEPAFSVPLVILMGQAATLPVLIAGVTLLALSGGGLYWLVGAFVFAYVAALTNAWVLLVEILR